MTPEFSRPQRADSVPDTGMAREISATPDECAAIARRLLIPAVASLHCEFHLVAMQGGLVIAHGRLHSRLTRECVVTLEEFETSTADRFTVHFVPEGHAGGDDDPDSPDEIAYRGLEVDLGEAAVEQLALALDPYPRKPGAVLPAEAAEPEAHPFEALARLRRSE
jgi:uncharacterized metal-binding protein YceD (DUF177 family)